MAPGIRLDNQVLGFLVDHLRLRRKGNAVQLVWETKSDITKGKIYSTLISEVNVTDIPSQRRGKVHHAKS